MRLAIISDTHDNLATLDKFLGFIEKNPVKAVIHCGDIAEGETLRHLAKNFDGKIFAAFGNMDYRDSVENVAKKMPGKITLFEDFGQAEFDGMKIGFCHHKETALRQCQDKKFDFIFYGHTHKPWIEKIETCPLANPGTLAGMFYLATFAILDTQTSKLELKILSRL
ncbi:MAG: YfcE family phosphodiesterase [Candidatus Paceibacterota bacterium]